MKPVAPVSATRGILMRAPRQNVVLQSYAALETTMHSIGGLTGEVLRFGAWSAQEG
jgi:hypothetical protein